jgi:hypothetical protein
MYGSTYSTYRTTHISVIYVSIFGSGSRLDTGSIGSLVSGPETGSGSIQIQARKKGYGKGKKLTNVMFKSSAVGWRFFS